MSISSKQFEQELGRLINRYCSESDLTIGEAVSAMLLAILDLREMMQRAKAEEEAEPE